MLSPSRSAMRSLPSSRMSAMRSLCSSLATSRSSSRRLLQSQTASRFQVRSVVLEMCVRSKVCQILLHDITLPYNNTKLYGCR